jgi:hypothetical protein
MNYFLLCNIVICYDSPTGCFNAELCYTIPYMSKFTLETTLIIFDPKLEMRFIETTVSIIRQRKFGH